MCVLRTYRIARRSWFARARVASLRAFRRRAGRGHFAVLLGEHAGGRDVRDGALELVLPAAHHVAIAAHHGVEASLCDVGGIVLLLRADFGVEHVGTLKEIGLGRARHEAGDGDPGPFQLRAQREGERINERLRAIIDCLVSAGHEAGDRSGDQDASLAARAHVAADFLNEVNGAGDVRVDDVAGGLEVLIEKGFAQTMSGVGEQRGNRSARDFREQLIYAFDRGEVSLDRFSGNAMGLESARGLRDRRLIGRDHEIESVFRAERREVITDTCRGTGDDSEWT